MDKGELLLAGPASPRVFISYRREDAAGHAGRLYDSLSSRPDVARVFMDVGDIDPGVDFKAAIAEALERADVVLALIGPRWTAASTPEGRRRLDDPDDHVVTEIATALEHDIRVIPLLLEGTPMPSADTLPERLEPLARRNAIELSTVSWQRDVEALVAALQRIAPQRHTLEPTHKEDAAAQIGTTIGPTRDQSLSSSGRNRHIPRGILWIGVGAILVGASIVVALVLGNNRDGPTTNTPPTAHGPGTISLGCEDWVPVPLSGEDPDGDPLGFGIILDPIEGSLGNFEQISDTEATVEYWRRQPGQPEAYTDRFEFSVEDGMDEDSASVEVLVEC